jgi:hypothetical protein
VISGTFPGFDVNHAKSAIVIQFFQPNIEPTMKALPRQQIEGLSLMLTAIQLQHFGEKVDGALRSSISHTSLGRDRIPNR